MPSLIKNSPTADKIVMAAAQLFAQQGYHGTSTREIARVAGVSENTMFRHFDHKEDLFWSALLSHTKGLKIRRDLHDGIAQCEAPEVVLPKILELLAETVCYRPQLLRLIAVAFLELHWKAEAFSHEHFSPILSSIRNYLDMSMRGGKLRDSDPTMMTAALMTTALMHPGISRLIDGNQASSTDIREVERAYAKFWLDVLAPRTTPILAPPTPLRRDKDGDA